MDLMTLVARLTLDSSDYEKGVHNSQSLISKAGSFIAGAVKTYIGVKAVGSLVRFGKESVAVGKQFDVAMSQVAATMGDKANQMTKDGQVAIDALRETAKKYGRETQFTATQAAEALNYMALAGYEAETAIGMLPNVLNLAAAGHIDLARASDMVTDAGSALGLVMEDGSVDIAKVNLMIDQMAKSASSGNTSVEQLGDAMLSLGATGRDVRGETAELSQVLTVLADNGIKGSEAGTKLRNILLSFQGKKFDKTFGKLGVSVRDTDGALRPIPDILNDMNKAMEGMNKGEKADLINNTFNRGDLAAVNALLGTNVQRWDELAEAISNAGGSAEAMAERQLDNLGGDMLKMQSAMEGFQIALSEKVTPALRFFTQMSTNAFGVFTKLLNGDLKKSVMETLGRFIPQKAMFSFQLITNSIRTFTSVFGELFGNIKEIFNTIWGAITDNVAVNAKAGFGDAFKFISNAIDGITEVMRKANRWITSMWEENGRTIMVTVLTALQNVRDFFSSAMSFISDVAQNVFTIVYGFWQKYGDSIISSVIFGVQRIWDMIVTVSGVIIETVSALMTTVWGIIEPILTIIMDYWKAHGEGIINFLATAFETIVSIIGNALQLIGSLIDTFTAACKWTWDNFGGVIMAVTSYIWNNIGNTIQTVMSVISNVIKLVTSVIKGDWQGAWNAVKNIFTSIWNGIKTYISNVLNTVRSLFSSIFGGIVTTVSEKFESIRSKIKEKIDKAKEAVDTAIQKIKGFFNFSWSLPKLKMPHISITGSFSLAPPSTPKFSIDWYKKAYDSIVEFANPTVIPTLSGYKGFGDGAGSELVMSKNTFFDAIESARGDTQFIFNIYPQKGQSEEEIARAVERKFIQWNNQKKGAFV